jgi:hypothetical protein
LSSSAPLRPTALGASTWQTQLSRDIEHRKRIEDAFDRAEAYQLMGDVELALAWLDTAGALSGGLPPEAHEQRARWARELADRRMPGDSRADGP